MNLWIIFLTGLTVGGLSCLAVQSGLLATVIASKDTDTKKTKGYLIYSTSIFLISKLLAYTLLGFVLGAFGGALNISSQVQSIMQLVAGVYMIAVALNLLNVHPIFRYAVIQPPKFLARIVRNQSKSKNIFAPALLGAMTIFIPCGTTIAMETLAISTVNPIKGALIMSAFVLGTIPLFLGIGVIFSTIGEASKTKFLKFAAILIIYLGVTSINGSLIALNSKITLQSVGENIVSLLHIGSKAVSANDVSATQNPEITITSKGYSPNYILVKKGIPVTITLTTKDAYSCASAFRIPSMGVVRNLTANDSQTITFTVLEKGKIPFSCSMGMYRGIIEAI